MQDKLLSIFLRNKLYLRIAHFSKSDNKLVLRMRKEFILFCILPAPVKSQKCLKLMQSKKISNDQELIQSDSISCPQNQKGNN